MSVEEILFNILFYGSLGVGAIGGLVFFIVAHRQARPSKPKPTIRKFDWTE